MNMHGNISKQCPNFNEFSWPQRVAKPLKDTKIIILALFTVINS